MNIKDLLTIKECALSANVSRTTIYNWINQGILPFYKKGASRLIDKQIFQRVNRIQSQNPYGVRGKRKTA